MTAIARQPWSARESTRDAPLRRGLVTLVRRIRREPWSTVVELADGLPITERKVRETLNVLELAGVIERQMKADRAGDVHVCVRWKDGS